MALSDGYWRVPFYEVLLEEGPLTRQMILSRVVAQGLQLKELRPLNQVSAILTADPRFEKVKGQRGFWNLAKNCQNGLTDAVKWHQEVYTPNKETTDASPSAASNQMEGVFQVVTTELTTKRQAENGKNPSALAPAKTQTVSALVVTALGEDEPDDGDAGRRRRGMAIAALGIVEKTRVGYRVRSQSDNPESPYYAIRLVGEDGPACECPDFELRDAPCKHIYGAQFSEMWEGKPAESPERTEQEKAAFETETVAKTPAVKRNWSDYNRAQVLEKPMFEKVLRNLCDTIPEPPQGMGRRRTTLSDRVLSMVLKVYRTKSTRRSMGYLEDAVRGGLLDKAPDFSAITRWMEDPEMTPYLVNLIERSALPFAGLEEIEEKYFAADSTGFTAIPYHRWFDYKHGRPRQKGRYVKAHFTVGVKSKIITAAVVTPGESSDSKQTPTMIKATSRNFNIVEFSGDKAYLSRDNFDLVAKAGGTAYFPFKKNSVPRNKRHKQDEKMDKWEEMYHYFHLHRDEWLKHYHRRSNVEAAVWMVKSKLGSFVRGKTDTAQVNECYTKLLAHNLIVLAKAMVDFEIEPTFGTGKLSEAEVAEFEMAA